MGILVADGVAVVGDPRSPSGALIDAKEVRALSEVVCTPHGTSVVAMRKPSITAEFSCSCQDGSGGCAVITTETTGGDPAISCVGDGCTGRCALFVKIPGNQFNLLVARAIGLDLSAEDTLVGDIAGTHGSLIFSQEVRFRKNADVTPIQTGKNEVMLMGRGGIKGSLKCSCSKGGGCELRITDATAICQRGTCKGRCGMVVTVPSIEATSASLLES